MLCSSSILKITFYLNHENENKSKALNVLSSRFYYVIYALLYTLKVPWLRWSGFCAPGYKYYVRNLKSVLICRNDLHLWTVTVLRRDRIPLLILTKCFPSPFCTFSIIIIIYTWFLSTFSHVVKKYTQEDASECGGMASKFHLCDFIRADYLILDSVMY